jgi:hypothetical protein
MFVCLQMHRSMYGIVPRTGAGEGARSAASLFAALRVSLLASV